uniref:Uncharacterized protein n=1 Tax=Octopus bimaculoides TaxID=37653 RepID=A0A0L8HN05_OCTBM
MSCPRSIRNDPIACNGCCGPYLAIDRQFIQAMFNHNLIPHSGIYSDFSDHWTIVDRASFLTSEFPPFTGQNQFVESLCDEYGGAWLSG